MQDGVQVDCASDSGDDPIRGVDSQAARKTHIPHRGSGETGEQAARNDWQRRGGEEKSSKRQESRGERQESRGKKPQRR